MWTEAPLPDLFAILDHGPMVESLREMARVRRSYAELMIETLIEALDALDPDPDLEPSLGSSNPVPPRSREPGWRKRGRVRCPMPDHLAFAQGVSDDREDVGGEDDEDGGDDEPSLGSLGSYSAGFHQALWATGGGNDNEAEHDGCEPDVDSEDGHDDEPSLGAPDGRIDQRFWTDGHDDERERDDDLEPTLGQPEGVYHNQTLWGRIGGTAHEDEDDERRLPGYREGLRLMAEAA